MPADAFIDTLAVNTHINYLDGAYANLHNVADDLAWLGIHHVREFTPGNAAPLSSYVFLAQRGIKFNLVMHQDVEAAVKEAARLGAAAPGSVAALEGYNEIDHWPVTYGGQTGMAGGLASQRAAFTQVRASPALAGVAVYDLTGYDPKTIATRADSADYVNLHVYPQNGEQPTWNANGDKWMPPAIETFKKYGLPAVITEFGYFSLPQAGWYMLGVDEATQAKGVLNGYMDAAAAGVKRTYVYELLDEKPDPEGKNNEMHYGMFRIDNSPKRVAQAIRNLTSILNAGGAAPVNRAAHGALGYTLTDLPPSANRLLLQKKDGRFVLVLWNETPIWNREKGTPLESAPAPVQLDFGALASRVDIYDPLVADTPRASHRNVRQLEVAMPDHPLLIEVTLAAAPRA
ncbi:calcium-binding protein [Paraburkholderia acidisoli]|uniref:Calcium-binding protein n=2 Tax=Paraburkholderia acidisoli TaxID=2571748 RepID=A0A7Z2GJX9_9BURK|nr:calcium-binding protein [Paraburkholderia acidisoli]